jgi:hypothetical protein
MRAVGSPLSLPSRLSLEKELHVRRVAAAARSCRELGVSQTALVSRARHSSRTRKCGTHRTANLRGRVIMSGHNAKQRTKHASAPKLHPPKIRSRSHLLTVKMQVSLLVYPTVIRKRSSSHGCMLQRRIWSVRYG